MSDLSARRRQEWCMRNFPSWRAKALDTMKLPESCWLVSSKSASSKTGKGGVNDVRRVAHSWAMATVCLVFTMLRWCMTLTATTASSACGVLRDFFANFFVDRELTFTFFTEGRVSTFPTQAYNFNPYLTGSRYRSIPLRTYQNGE